MHSPARPAWKRLPAAARARSTITADAVYRALTSEFDPQFYAEQLSLPARRITPQSRQRLLAHYITTGWKEGKSPSREFDVTRYLAHNADVAASGMEPLRHYLVHGRAEGRMAFMAEPPDAVPAPLASTVPHAALARLGLTQHDVRALAAWFDEAFYRRAYPEPHIAGAHALAHYLEQGWKEGRDPSAEFSTDFYLSANPDVKARGVMPLLHFARTGRAEGRPHRFMGAWRARLLARVEGLDARARQWKRPDPQQLLDVSHLEAALASKLPDPARKAVVIALLQDRYQVNIGGIQMCAQDEQRHLNGQGHAYIALNPYQPLPRLAAGDPEAWLCDVSVNGQCVGTARGEHVLAALARQLQPYRSHLVVHSLLGHHGDWVERLGDAVRFEQRLFWVHDFFSLCTGYNLLRNDVSACGAPPAGSDSCRLCVHGTQREAHLGRLHGLFRRMSFQVVAPSGTALALWASKTGLPHAGTRVLPHRELAALPRSRPARLPGRGLRVAFIGQPAAHKGWFIFRDLVDSLRRDTRYAWFHLGTAGDPHPALTHVDVRHAIDRPHAMREAIEAQEIDVALVLSQLPETYCLAAHEAIAGGAFIAALANGGNVVDVVRSSTAGQVFDDEQQLLMALRDGSLIGAVDGYQAHRPTFEMRSSGISAAALLLPTEDGTR